MDERRKFQRYEMNQQCLVRHPETVGILMDLSLGGLSCECIDYSDDAPAPCQKVDLLCHGDTALLQDLLLEVITTEKVPGEFLPNFWSRKCRARFTDLRAEQVKMLEDYISTHATH